MPVCSSWLLARPMAWDGCNAANIRIRPTKGRAFFAFGSWRAKKMATAISIALLLAAAVISLGANVIPEKLEPVQAAKILGIDESRASSDAGASAPEAEREGALRGIDSPLSSAGHPARKRTP